MTSTPSGKLIVISGPSGSGKTTLLKKLFARCPQIKTSVSATTRPPRPGERDGVDYYFLNRDDFEQRRRNGEFLECFEVFSHGHWYGTLITEVSPRLEDGKWVLLEIDVQGAMAVLERYPDAITIFVRPNSVEELERRLRGRGTETSAAIERRLSVAASELAQADRYQHQVCNDDVDRAVQEICEILTCSGVCSHD